MLPQDPMILMSYLNTKLRDEYASLEDFCFDSDLSPDELTSILAAAGYRYDEALNQFRPV